MIKTVDFAVDMAHHRALLIYETDDGTFCLESDGLKDSSILEEIENLSGMSIEEFTDGFFTIDG